MKTAFIFPGQGSQSVGMGKDLYEKYDEIKEVYKKVQDITGIDIAKLTFEGPEEELFQTKNTQLAIYTMSIAILEVMKKNGILPEYSAGLSLGEYSALYCGQAFNFEDGIKIVQRRGELMQELVPKGDWAMVAVLGLEDEKVAEVCKSIDNGVVAPANYNCPGQVAISGERKAVLQAMEQMKLAGARKCVELKTAGPFHTEFLKEASEALKQELEGIKIQMPQVPVIKNIDAKPYSQTDDIKDILSRHVISPVQFAGTIKYMISQGVDTFIEIGPGKTLTSFVKKVDKELSLYNINDVESLESIINK